MPDSGTKLDAFKNPWVFIVMLLLFGGGGVGIGRYTANDMALANKQEIAVIKEKLVPLSETVVKLAEAWVVICRQVDRQDERLEGVRSQLDKYGAQLQEILRLLKALPIGMHHGTTPYASMEAEAPGID